MRTPPPCPILARVLVLPLQITVTEGAGGFNPLTTGPNVEAFRLGFKPFEASTTAVFSARVGYYEPRFSVFCLRTLPPCPILARFLVLRLQITVTEGAGGFNPLTTGPNVEAFRPGFKPFEASRTVVSSARVGYLEPRRDLLMRSKAESKYLRSALAASGSPATGPFRCGDLRVRQPTAPHPAVDARPATSPRGPARQKARPP
jgi:hypothetical protein